MGRTIFRQNESSYDEELCLKTIFKSKRNKYMFGFLGVFFDSLIFSEISYLKFELNQMVSVLTSQSL